MSGKPDHCKCGKGLEFGETTCPSCTRARQSFWARVGSAVVATATVAAPIIFAVVKKIKLKA